MSPAPRHFEPASSAFASRREPATPGQGAPPPPPGEELERILRVTLRVGVAMAVAGASAFRVRATLQRVALSFGVEHAEFVFAIDSLHATLRSGGRSISEALRVAGSGVNMNRVTQLELLSRQLFAEPGRRTTEELDAELDALELAPPLYPLWATGPLLGLACGAFCGVIGGTWWQIAAAALGTYAGHLLRLHHLKTHPPIATVVVTCAFLSALTSWGVARGLALVASGLPLGIGAEALAPGKAVLACVLYLIPGVPLVNSLIDLLHFDLNAGLARGAFALLVIVCIAVGVLGFLSLTGFAVS